MKETPEERERRLAKIKEKTRAYANSAQGQDRYYLRKYGISLEYYQGLLQKQGGVCACCYVDLRDHTPHLDHDHATGIIRGILCHHCNVALGLVRDDVRVLRNLIAYLETPPMLLSARILSPFSDVNNFDVAQVFQMSSGEQQVMTFQLIDAAKCPPTQCFYPFGLRYMPAAGAVLQCTLQAIDGNQNIVRYASQPYPTQDPSIWQLTLMSTDTLVGTFALKLSLSEGGVIKKGSLQQAVQIGADSAATC
jgi:hypothetical protein